MGVIQSSINQGISVAAMLFTQTPAFKAKVEQKLTEQQFKKTTKEIEDISSATSKLGSKVGRKNLAEKQQLASLEDRLKSISRANPTMPLPNETLKIFARQNAQESLSQAQSEKRIKRENKIDFNNMYIGGEKVPTELAKELYKKAQKGEQ